MRITVPEGRYSQWCEKRPLACSDKDILKKANGNLYRNDLTSLEKNIMFVHDLVGVQGIEFVLASSGKFNSRVNLPEKITIVPCFLPEITGKNSNDPLVNISYIMMTQSRFIYDGWIPLFDWSIGNLRNKIHLLNKILSLFSIQERISIRWEPKYWIINKNQQSYQEIKEEHVNKVVQLYENTRKWNEKDSWAYFRSIGWLSQSLTLPPSPSRFLLCIVAMESLATYIENITNTDSIF
ncbi:hypothetical protein E4H04_12975, partial [Candidatus Bathyarchaeota archaeon]